MSWILEYFVIYLLCVYIYICSAGYVELPIVLLYLLECLVYHMLSKTRKNSINRSYRVTAYQVYLLYLLRCLVHHMLLLQQYRIIALHTWYYITKMSVVGLIVTRQGLFIRRILVSV